MGKKKLEIIKNSDLQKIINDGINWITNSGIQNKRKKDKNYGGYYAWFDEKKRKYSYLYSEITGYLITFHCFIYSLNKSKKNLVAAEAAATWLINRAQFSFGGFKCFELINKNLNILDKSSLSYSFDNGVILNGLVNLYKITKKKKYLNSATRCADWIIICSKKEGVINPVFDTDKNKFIYDKKSWSMIPGSYHAKISIGLYNIYSITKKKIYLNVANAIIQKSINWQKKNGMFLSTANHLNLHPHCYSAEGIWVAANLFKKNFYYKSVISAVCWVEKNIKNNLPPRLFFNNKKIIYNYRVDSISQLLRLMFALNINKKIKLNHKLVKNLLNIIFKNLAQSKKKKINGGFYWGMQSNGKKTYCVNTWTSSFVLQTLIYLQKINSGKKNKLNPFHII
ncbi:AGE family epimerase/isomerase [Candidatus Pelagibacter sp.]|nr:AGE family epimerase/isomerase [Candidatus Pelagibacter sp.]